MTRFAVPALLAALSAALPAAAQPASSYESALAGLEAPGRGDRLRALRTLADIGRADAAAAVAPLVLDASDEVQLQAVDTALRLFTLPRDLAAFEYGIPPPAGERTFPEAAFDAGPLATLPAPVAPALLTSLARAMRDDASLKVRLAAGYALGVLAAPAMGPLDPAAAAGVTEDVVYALQRPDPATRQVVARVAGRVFAPRKGEPASVAVGDALIGALNDRDRTVRLWATDSLGRLRYARGVQALSERYVHFGTGDEGVAAAHALSRIAAPGSESVLRAMLTSRHAPLRVIAIEGLGRIGKYDAVPIIAAALDREREASVRLAAAFAYLLLGGPDNLDRLAEGLEQPATEVQARIYLEEVAARDAAALHPLLSSPNARVRQLVVERIGLGGNPASRAVLEPMRRDAAPSVAEAAADALRRIAAAP